MSLVSIGPLSLVYHLLCGLRAQDVRVTSVEDGHGGAAEELSARGAEFDLCAPASQPVSPSTARGLLLGARERRRRALQSRRAPSLGALCVWRWERLTLLPEKWWTWVLANML